jgi:NADH dehydrogenase
VSAVQGFVGPDRVTPASVDRDGNINLIDAAATVNADVVLLSTIGAAANSPMALFRAKHAAEQHLKASSSGWSIVRASAFAELWADIMAKPIVFGRGDNPINFVSVADVADVVEQVVLDPASRGQTFEVGGPEDLTFNELADILHNAGRNDGKVRHVPRWVLRATAPASRRSRAALTMDTTDMRFDAGPARVGAADVPMSDVTACLTARGARISRPGDAENAEPCWQDHGMATPSHATLATFRVDLTREAQQRQGLDELIVPGVRRFPGFVTGHWTLDRTAAESIVLLTYDSLTAAESMADNIRGNADNQRQVGLELVDVRVLEVAASA